MPRSNRSSSPLKPPDVESCMTPLSRPRARMFLRMVLTDQRLMSLWLNTLSFLEYMGARKIAKSLRQDHFNEELLGHLSEEARHSLFFKKLAMKFAPPYARGKSLGFRPSELFAGKEARAYFQKLDLKAMELASSLSAEPAPLPQAPAPQTAPSQSQAQAAPSNPKPSGGKSAESHSLLNYLLTTWIIEKRALWLYGDFDELLKEIPRLSVSLSPVLRDEKSHIQAVEASLKKGWPAETPRFLSLLEDFEEEAFAEFQCALEETIAGFADGLVSSKAPPLNNPPA